MFFLKSGGNLVLPLASFSLNQGSSSGLTTASANLSCNLSKINCFARSSSGTIPMRAQFCMSLRLVIELMYLIRFFSRSVAVTGVSNIESSNTGVI